MNQREIAISSINGLRTIIAQKLIVALNDHWNRAAFGHMSLNYRMILQLVKVIKDCSHRIQGVCQAQNSHMPWTLVAQSKKRFGRNEDHSAPAKLRKIEGQ